ncbi:ATP-dependent DNA helicase PIF1-like [Topomyia yanbarensis]|uniref:ATP-dependent DNA helicase PIF1-like n=1 Tax=Topomyia yanbarensis TaxID=2498891 RepID=UPI00273C337D|nr:ATP-dependent DNA helicase PIF1-like [Topomyia yanbarensis]
MSRRNNASLSLEALQLYRNAFANVKAVIVDEVSMIGADALNNVHTRLQNITGNYDDPFGGSDIIFCGDLRQLPPVNARPVCKPCTNSMHGAVLWQSLDFFPLVRVMRQTDEQFSTVLTKIGNGEQLTAIEKETIESRFRTTEWCKLNVPSAVRLFHRNADVERYNRESLNVMPGLDCTAEDAFAGHNKAEQLASSRTKLYKMSVAETGCLPYMVRLVLGMPYMVTTNVDVEDGLVNGAIWELKMWSMTKMMLKRKSSNYGSNSTVIQLVLF